MSSKSYSWPSYGDVVSKVAYGKSEETSASEPQSLALFSQIIEGITLLDPRINKYFGFSSWTVDFMILIWFSTLPTVEKESETSFNV